MYTDGADRVPWGLDPVAVYRDNEVIPLAPNETTEPSFLADW